MKIDTARWQNEILDFVQYMSSKHNESLQHVPKTVIDESFMRYAEFIDQAEESDIRQL